MHVTESADTKQTDKVYFIWDAAEKTWEGEKVWRKQKESGKGRVRQQQGSAEMNGCVFRFRVKLFQGCIFLQQRCKVSRCIILWWWQTHGDGGSEGWSWRRVCVLVWLSARVGVHMLAIMLIYHCVLAACRYSVGRCVSVCAKAIHPFPQSYPLSFTL